MGDGVQVNRFSGALDEDEAAEGKGHLKKRSPIGPLKKLKIIKTKLLTIGAAPLLSGKNFYTPIIPKLLLKTPLVLGAGAAARADAVES